MSESKDPSDDPTAQNIREYNQNNPTRKQVPTSWSPAYFWKGVGVSFAFLAGAAACIIGMVATSNGHPPFHYNKGLNYLFLILLIFVTLGISAISAYSSFRFRTATKKSSIDEPEKPGQDLH